MSRRRMHDPAGTHKSNPQTGRFAYEGLDRVMHEKARLGIMASLAANAGGLLFNDLKKMCSLTDGNLSRHLVVLADAGLVDAWKGTKGSRPQSMYRLTEMGRQKFADYIGVLEKVVADAQSDGREVSKRGGAKGMWSPA